MYPVQGRVARPDATATCMVIGSHSHKEFFTPLSKSCKNPGLFNVKNDNQFSYLDMCERITCDSVNRVMIKTK